MRRRGKATVAGIVVLSCALGYGLLHGWGPRPVEVPGPPDPLPTLTAGADGSPCTGGDGWDDTPVPALFWVGVDRDPQSVTALWWPTVNDHDCRVVVTVGTRATADALAADVRAAPAFPRGTFNCPSAVGGMVDLYFAYQGGRWERVRVDPTGCATLTARWRKLRQSLLGGDLAAIAPPGEWSRLLN